MKPFWLGALLGMAAGALIVLASRPSSPPAVTGGPHTIHEAAIEARLDALDHEIHAISNALHRVEATREAARPEAGAAGTKSSESSEKEPRRKRIQLPSRNDVLLHDILTGFQRAVSENDHGGDEEFNERLTKRYRLRSVKTILEQFGAPDEVTGSGGAINLEYLVPTSEEGKFWEVDMSFSSGLLTEVNISTAFK